MGFDRTAKIEGLIVIHPDVQVGRGEPMTYDGVRREIYKLAEKAGVKFSAHRARRFYARFLYKEGLDLEELRLLMRHEKIDTTKDYIQLMQEDAIDSLRKRKIEFFENGSRVNPDRSSRPGRDERAPGLEGVQWSFS